MYVVVSIVSGFFFFFHGTPFLLERMINPPTVAI